MKTSFLLTLVVASMVAWASCAQADPFVAYNTVTYYHNDVTGSPVVATNQQAQVVWRKTYTPYGESTGKDSDNRKGFTGHVEDANGLVYAGARYYDPALGRFLSTDPVGFSESNLMSFNRYAYANNNPYKYVDPDGRVVETAWDIANVVMDVSSMGMNLAAGNYGGAALDAGALLLDGAAVIFPGVPGGAGTLLKAARGADKAIDVAKGEATVIGRVKDLQNLKQGEKSLLDRLPDQGSSKANWKQNSGVLRQEMGKGQPIRDASPGDTAGQFLNAERNLLQDRGWTINPKTNYWNPPAQ
jgi:RHS repeat-associated protein